MLKPEEVALLRSEPCKGPNRVKRAMDLAGVTQEQVADAIGVTQPYISSICKGRHERLPLNKVRALANYFGLRIDDLFPEQTSQEQVA